MCVGTGERWEEAMDGGRKGRGGGGGGGQAKGFRELVAVVEWQNWWWQMGGRRPGSLSSLCSCAWLWCTGGCSPEHSNHNKLGGNSGLLRSLRACDQKVAPRYLRESEGLRESERENPWGLTGFVLLLHFFMQESPCVELSLFGPVGKLAGCL